MKKTLLIGLIFVISVSFAQVATTTIPNINNTVIDNTHLLFGITFDARTSMTGSKNFGQLGYYNANGSIIPAVDAIFNDFPMSTLRYPANAVSFGFDWKRSVGPVASRQNQPATLLGALGVAQPMNFGFDEFMAMSAAKGVSGNDIQIMVQIYDNTSSGLNATQTSMAITDPVGTNADWVEYCNTPNDGSNPGGGIDWAAQRAANGHPAPYGIKIWNIGNEPWATANGATGATGEFGNTATNCNSYLAYVTPIIDAMLAIDPTLHITLPSTGYAGPGSPNSWASAILNSSIVAQHKIYGISQHYFLNENPSGGTIQTGVVAAQNNLTALINYATTKGVKVLIGDYAHSIPTSPPTTHNDANENLAMQWQGANLEADFLLMVSQRSNIDRVNFWAYGMPYGVWHPIRINSIGNYTLMPAADIYKKLFPAFLNKSLVVTTTSPAASDGNAYSVRSGAFISTDATKLNFVAVNRDKLNSVPYLPTVPTGYALSAARLITATSLQAESFSEDSITADGNGNYYMPALSILILEYVNVSLSVNESIPETNTMTLFPNPANESVTLKSNNNKDLEIKIYNTLGQLVKTESLKENGLTINVVSLKIGTYIVAIVSKELTIYRKLIIYR